MIGVVDDLTRLAYCELHAGERPSRWPRRFAAPPPGSQSRAAGRSRLLCDNARAYTLEAFAAALAELDGRHILTPPYTPRWNGKVERFFGTLDCEWAPSRAWPSSRERHRPSLFLRF